MKPDEDEYEVAKVHFCLKIDYHANTAFFTELYHSETMTHCLSKCQTDSSINDRIAPEW